MLYAVQVLAKHSPLVLTGTLVDTNLDDACSVRLVVGVVRSHEESNPRASGIERQR